MNSSDEEVNGDVMRMLSSPFRDSPVSLSKQHHTFFMNRQEVPQLNMPQFNGQLRQISPNSGVENGNRKVGIPPSHPQIPPMSPFSQIPMNRPGNPSTGMQNFSTSPVTSHTRSLSQPSFFALDSLPPLSPYPFRETLPTSISDQILADVSMDNKDGSGNSRSLLPPSPFTKGSSFKVGESLPPRKTHRRSNSDVPFGFSSAIHSSPPLTPLRSPGALDRSISTTDHLGVQSLPLFKGESSRDRKSESKVEEMGERISEGEVVDDLFSAYMNLDNIDAFNSSCTDEKQGCENMEDLDSRASGSKTNGCDSSDNEATSSVKECGNMPTRVVSIVPQKREGTKRNASEDIAPTNRHYRSVSMDSFMGKLNFANELSKMPPSPVSYPSQLSPTDSAETNSNAFSLEFGNGEFSGAELKKIMANEKLAEIASSDPKRAKRILANRQSAARSKERKTRYISELELKVQTLQVEATTLSTKLTLLQRDSAGLSNQNNELKFRLQAMEQQAQLQDALNEALTAEVHRLKVTKTELGEDTSKFQQLSINHQPFQLHQLQPLGNGQAMNGNSSTKNESKQ